MRVWSPSILNSRAYTCLHFILVAMILLVIYNFWYLLQRRIVGGEETGINEYPAMAALINVVLRDLYCGASIISNRYALTVAHCARPAEETGLLVGDHDISTGNVTLRKHIVMCQPMWKNKDYNYLLLFTLQVTILQPLPCTRSVSSLFILISKNRR